MSAFRTSTLPRGRLRLLAERWPRGTGLTSYLSGCIRLAVGWRDFRAAPMEEVLRALPDSPAPRRAGSLSRPAWFRPGLLVGWTHRNAALRPGHTVATKTLWVTVSIHVPKLAVNLTRLGRGFLLRASPHSSFVA